MQRNSRVRKFSAVTVAALVLATVVAGGPAFARESAPAPTAQATGVSASSQVMFRVIIRERLDAGSGLQKQTDQRTTAQRRLETVEGRQVLTIAAP